LKRSRLWNKIWLGCMVIRVWNRRLSIKTEAKIGQANFSDLLRPLGSKILIPIPANKFCFQAVFFSLQWKRKNFWILSVKSVTKIALKITPTEAIFLRARKRNPPNLSWTITTTLKVENDHSILLFLPC